MRGPSLMLAMLLLSACLPPQRGQLELSASTLDFGMVRPGNVVIQSLELRNGDGVPLMRLAFRPEVIGPRVAQLRAQTDLVVRPSLELNLTGEGVP